jgi:HSP20 family protein
MAHELSKRSNQGGNIAHRREHPLQQLRRNLDTLFGPLWGGWLDQDFEPMRVWDFDMKEDDKEICVRAEMPGFDENELEVQLDDNVLTIRAEKEQKGEGGREEYRSFYRSIALPSGVDTEKVQATYRNGVLEMHIPRTESAKPKRINIGGQQGALGQSSQSASGQQGSMGQMGESSSQTQTGGGQKTEASSGNSGQPGNASKSNPSATKTPEKAQK